MAKERDRKNRGSLSVLDEFTEGVGDIVAQPKLSADKIKKIEERTRLADAPMEVKSHLSSQQSEPLPLDRREIGVRQALDKPLDRRETGVSQALDKNTGENLGVRQALDKPLDRRETGVRQNENSALEIAGIVGKEKTLVLHIAEECRKLGELETNYIGTEDLKNLLSLDSLGLRNIIFRVKEKGFFEVAAKQLGRVGLRKFKISRSIYQQAITSALDSRETAVSQALDKPLDKPLDGPPYSSSNELLNINTITTELPENLKRFGISVVNLQNLVTSGKTTQNVVDRSLAALSYDVQSGKTGNLANILFGVLNSGREYISQKYSESLQAELDQELARIAVAEDNQKLMVEARLKSKFQEHLRANPQFFDLVKEKHKGYIKGEELLEKMAFEEFKTIEGVSQ